MRSRKLATARHCRRGPCAYPAIRDGWPLGARKQSGLAAVVCGSHVIINAQDLAQRPGITGQPAFNAASASTPQTCVLMGEAAGVFSEVTDDYTTQNLSARQRDVMNLIVRGLSSKEIASILNLAEGLIFLTNSNRPSVRSHNDRAEPMPWPDIASDQHSSRPTS
jgi:hypothetical protein